MTLEATAPKKIHAIDLKRQKAKTLSNQLISSIRTDLRKLAIAGANNTHLTAQSTFNALNDYLQACEDLYEYLITEQNREKNNAS